MAQTAQEIQAEIDKIKNTVTQAKNLGYGDNEQLNYDASGNVVRYPVAPTTTDTPATSIGIDTTNPYADLSRSQLTADEEQAIKDK
jgi:hypothetical protein